LKKAVEVSMLILRRNILISPSRYFRLPRLPNN
jgi:hypothetical protein